MNEVPSANLSPVRHPCAWIPIAMSIAALVLLLSDLAIFGVTHDPDEGAAAHIWQLLMVGQLPFIAFYAIKWLPRTPKRALPVLCAQFSAALAAIAPVYFLGL